MKTGFTIIFVIMLNAPNGFSADADWPWWRGPTRNGVAPAGQNPPTTWSATKNVLWKMPIPGRGRSTPIFSGNRIFLTTAEDVPQRQWLMALHRGDGKVLWKTRVHQGGFPEKIHRKNTHATCTPATNGKLVFTVFNRADAIFLSAVDVEGKIVWQRNAGSYKPEKYKYGYAPSPLLFGDTVIVASDYEGHGFLAAFDQKTGEPAWRTERNGKVGYSSPILGHVAGRDQVLLSGAGLVTGYNPANGKLLWSVKGTSISTAGTMTWWDDLAIAGGGYPAKGIDCVRADGSGEVVWRSRHPVYEQSMLVHEGFLYLVNDAGIAYCLNVKTGEEQWRARLGGSFSSSPILAGGRIYVANERGSMFVLKPNPKKFERLAENKLSDEGFTSPVFLDDRIYWRTAFRGEGKHQDVLFCLGNK